MILFKRTKDGGPESTVSGLYLIEIKSLFTIVILTFEGSSREAFHNHAFNAISWVVKGVLVETLLSGGSNIYGPSSFPIITTRERFHKVDSPKTTTVVSFRGPWKDTWQEFIPNLKKFITMTHGRKQV